jgi:hypothetical protein
LDQAVADAKQADIAVAIRRLRAKKWVFAILRMISSAADFQNTVVASASVTPDFAIF